MRGEVGTKAPAFLVGTTIASMGLRSGTDPRDLAKGLVGIACHRSPMFDEGQKINSCADAIGRALSSMYPPR